MVDGNVTLSVPAVEKLIDHAASGIGSATALIFAPLIARLKSKATMIEAEATAGSFANDRSGSVGHSDNAHSGRCPLVRANLILPRLHV